jgi:hypothetical protein
MNNRRPVFLKYFIYCALMSWAQHSSAAMKCQDLEPFTDQTHLESFKVIMPAKIITRKNWNSWQVIGTHLSVDQCLKNLKQDLIEIRGDRYWFFRSDSEKCDGGNTFGVIYTTDLKSSVVHIYDGQWTCVEQ